jgi:hypothetical protein
METFAQLMSFLDVLGMSNAAITEALRQLPLLREQSHILYLPDRFNVHFAKVGWVAFESFNLDVMRQAVTLADAGQFEEAEHLLAEYYNDKTLQWSLLQLWGIEQFRPREVLAQFAKDDYLAGRYHACIPNVLMIIDGLVNDIAQTGFFADGTNLTAWDSIAAHSSGLQVIAKIFSTNRTKTTVEPISIPYRNGILHGRDLGYANKIVAAKCWATLFAIGDWARALQEGKKYPRPAEQAPSLSALLQQWEEMQQLAGRMEQWKQRDLFVGGDVPATGSPEDYEDRTPERTFAKFMMYWERNNYGKMATLIVDYFKRPVNTRAREIRRDFAHIKPKKYSILSINNTDPGMTTITTLVTYVEDEEKTTEITVHLIYADEENTPILRGEPHGKWIIHQRSFGPIIYPRLTETA